MRRSRCTILALFVLATSSLEAQESKSQSSESAALSTGGDATVLRLLQESHDLGQQLPVSSRLMNLLAPQVEMVSRLRPDLGREWANELFTLSFQTKGTQRSLWQNTAMRVLIRLDPNRALELLHSLTIEEIAPERATSPPPGCRWCTKHSWRWLGAMERVPCPCWSKKRSAWASRGTTLMLRWDMQ